MPGSTQFLDTSALPVARMPAMPSSAAQIEQWLLDMETLMQAGQVFVLLYERLPEPGERGDPDSRKKTVLWLKAHREAFGAHCRGMVLLCGDANALPHVQAMLEPLEKAYRVTVRVACSADEARSCALQLAGAR